jgi:hypothetical protein
MPANIIVTITAISPSSSPAVPIVPRAPSPADMGLRQLP